MAASFKQQCPSCEAMVLVKDQQQIGKKVDCPRCKYRFVVEPPAEEAEAEEGEEIKDDAKGKPKASETITAKKPSSAPANPAVRKKVGPRKGGDEAEAKPKRKKKQSSGSMVLVFGIGVSICAVALLGIGGYFLILAPKDDSRKGVTIVTKPTRPATDTAPAKKAGLALVEMTNLLPNDTQAIYNLNIKDLVGGAVGRAAFQTPGAFQYEFIEQHFGLRAKEVDQVLIAQNFEKDWVFVAVRITPDEKKPLNLEELKKSLNLQPGPDSPFTGQEYFTAAPSPWLDNLGSLLGAYYPQLKLAPPLRLRKPCLRIVDSHTLVIADEEPLKAFLTIKGQPKTLAAKDAPTPSKGRPSKTFLTVNPELKALIELMEGKNRSVICAAWEMAPVRDRMLRAADLLKPTGLADEKLANLIKELEAAGACLQMRDKMFLNFGLRGRDPGFYKLATQQLKEKAEVAGQKGLFNSDQVRVELDGKPLAPSPSGRLPKGQVLPVPDVKISIHTRPADQVLVLSAELQFNAVSSSMALTNFLKPQMLVLRGLTDMVGSPSRLHELSKAVTELAQKNDLPRGAFDRPVDANRLGRPYPPSERVGWMAELLPFLGYENVKGTIKFDESWKSRDNMVPGSVLIPAFLDARSPPNTWWVRLPHLGGRSYAATHFVGIAGVGLDAAEYDAKDQNVMNKLGILGYDRQTGLADIRDGAANTILMLQVPPTYQRPWIAGGGATLTGVPEKNSIRPFVGTYGNNRGTYAIMADGSVRFLSEKISDEAFKAMCTVNGSEKVDVNKEAPQTILKAQPALPK